MDIIKNDLQKLRLSSSQRFQEIAIGIHNVNFLFKLQTEKMTQSLYDQLPMKWLNSMGKSNVVIEIFEGSHLLSIDLTEAREDKSMIFTSDYLILTIKPDLVKVFLFKSESYLVFEVLRTLLPSLLFEQGSFLLNSALVLNKKNRIDIYVGEQNLCRSFINTTPMHRVLSYGYNLIYQKEGVFMADIVPLGQELINLQKIGVSFVLDKLICLPPVKNFNYPLLLENNIFPLKKGKDLTKLLIQLAAQIS